jgi:hypothetical protein
MTLSTTATLYTPEDLLTLPDYGRFELIDGHLVERQMGAQSSYAATNVLGLVWYFVRSNHLGLVFQADCGYQIFAEDPGRSGALRQHPPRLWGPPHQGGTVVSRQIW